MAPKTLTDLPPELQLTVVEYIPKSSDLKSICLTCKELRIAALPTLYHKVVIHLDECTIPALNGIFLANNSGRAYTRVLVFEKYSSRQLTMAWRTMSVALQLLVRDSLTEIRLDPGLVLDLDFLLSLSANQRKLKRIWLPPVGRIVAVAASSPAFSWEWLQNVESLMLPCLIESLEDIQGYHQFIKHAGKVKEMGLWTHKTESNKGLERQLRATAQSDGVLLSTLFSHIAPFGSGSALQCSRLDLSRSRLLYETRFLSSIFNFCALRRLTLISCSGAGVLLRALTSSFSGGSSALKRFSYVGKPIEVAVLKGFLQSFSGLLALKLRYTQDTQADFFDMSCLRSHRTTLAQLILRMQKAGQHDGQDTVALSRHQVSSLCHECPCLRHLGLALPIITLGEAGGVDLGDLPLVIDELAKLQRLDVLNVANWPTLPNGTLLHEDDEVDPEASEDRRLEIEPYNQLHVLAWLDTLATELLRHFARGKGTSSVLSLPTLWFGAQIPSPSYAVSVDRKTTVPMQPTSYFATAQTDRYGRMAIKAERIRAEEHKYLEGDQDEGTLVEFA
ncbi:hypothetical protein LTR85_003673 [Meristemomyces frigidus]|nr:hypothetical protein LTR85_003673 [Meristemomyces frigidus]